MARWYNGVIGGSLWRIPDPWHKVSGGDGQTSLDFRCEQYTGCLSPTLPHPRASEQRGHYCGDQHIDKREPMEGQELTHRSVHVLSSSARAVDSLEIWPGNVSDMNKRHLKSVCQLCGSSPIWNDRMEEILEEIRQPHRYKPLSSLGYVLNP